MLCPICHQGNIRVVHQVWHEGYIWEACCDCIKKKNLSYIKQKMKGNIVIPTRSHYPARSDY